MTIFHVTVAGPKDAKKAHYLYIDESDKMTKDEIEKDALHLMYGDDPPDDDFITVYQLQTFGGNKMAYLVTAP